MRTLWERALPANATPRFSWHTAVPASRPMTAPTQRTRALWERSVAAKAIPRFIWHSAEGDQPRSAGTEDSSNGLLLRRWLRSSRGVAPKKLR